MIFLQAKSTKMEFCNLLIMGLDPLPATSGHQETFLRQALHPVRVSRCGDFLLDSQGGGW